MAKNWVNKIRLLTGTGESRQNTEFNIGTTFDNVQYDEKNAYTLKDFVDSMKAYFQKHMFMKYGTNEPRNKAIMEWYQVQVGEVQTPDEQELNW